MQSPSSDEAEQGQHRPISVTSGARCGAAGDKNGRGRETKDKIFDHQKMEGEIFESQLENFSNTEDEFSQTEGSQVVSCSENIIRKMRGEWQRKEGSPKMLFAEDEEQHRKTGENFESPLEFSVAWKGGQGMKQLGCQNEEEREGRSKSQRGFDHRGKTPEDKWSKDSEGSWDPGDSGVESGQIAGSIASDELGKDEIEEEPQHRGKRERWRRKKERIKEARKVSIEMEKRLQNDSIKDVEGCLTSELLSKSEGTEGSESQAERESTCSGTQWADQWDQTDMAYWKQGVLLQELLWKLVEDSR